MFDTLELGWKLEGRKIETRQWEDGLYTYFYSLDSQFCEIQDTGYLLTKKAAIFYFDDLYLFSPIIPPWLGQFCFGATVDNVKEGGYSQFWAHGVMHGYT